MVLAIAAPAAGGQEPRSLIDDVRAERSKYTAPLSNEQLAEILDAVAWKNRAEGWGLSRKSGGNRCESPRLQGLGPIACDILEHRPTGGLYDVFGDVDGAATPGWGRAHPHNDSNRPWVAPVEPVGSIELPPPPPTCEYPDVRPDLAACQAGAGRLQEIYGQLERELAEIFARAGELERERDSARRELEELKARPEPPCEAKVPGWIKSLGIRVGCQIIRP